MSRVLQEKNRRTKSEKSVSQKSTRSKTSREPPSKSTQIQQNENSIPSRPEIIPKLSSESPSFDLPDIYAQILENDNLSENLIKTKLKSYSNEKFYQKLENCICHVLSLKPNQIDPDSKEKLYNFSTKILCEYICGDETFKPHFPVFEEIIEFLTGTTIESGLIHVRKNSLELISLILENIPTTCDYLHEGIYAKVITAVLPLFLDQTVSTRMMAIRTLARLQQPEEESDGGCVIINAMAERAVNDTSEDVKILVLEKIRSTKRSFMHVTQLLRHKSDKVQNAVFSFFAKRKSNPKSVNTCLRLEITKLGLGTKSEMFSFLIKKWFDKLKFKKIPVFLSLFDVEENSKLCEELVDFLITTIFNKTELQAFTDCEDIDGISFMLDDKYAENLEIRDIEHIFYWRILFENENVPKPKLTKLLKFIQEKVTDKLVKLSKDLHDNYDGTDDELDNRGRLEFCFQQFMYMLKTGYNYFDKNDRDMVWMFLIECLTSIHFTGLNLELWNSVGKLLLELFPDEQERFFKCSEFINSVLEEPEEDEFENSGFHMELFDDDEKFKMNQLKIEMLKIEDELEAELEIDGKKQLMSKLQNLRAQFNERGKMNLAEMETDRSNSNEKSEFKKSDSQNSLEIRNLFKIVEFICQIVQTLNFDEVSRTGLSTRMLEQWAREIVQRSYKHIETFENIAYRTAVFRCFGLIGCISQNQARNSIYLFKEILSEQRDYDLDTQADAITMIKSIVDFLQVHNLSDLIKVDNDRREEVHEDVENNFDETVHQHDQTTFNPTVEKASPAQLFIKSLADVFYETYTKSCADLSETGELAQASLTAIIKLYVRGIIYSHMNLFVKLVDKALAAETISAHRKMLEFFLRQLTNDFQSKQHYLVKPFINIVKKAVAKANNDDTENKELINLLLNLLKQNSTRVEIVELNTRVLEKLSANYTKIPVDYTIHILDQLVLLDKDVEESEMVVENEENGENDKNKENISENYSENNQETQKSTKIEQARVILENIIQIQDSLGSLSAMQKRKFKKLQSRYAV